MSKYRNKKITVNGETFDSQAEYWRYFHLQQMEKAGMINGLTRQVKFELAPKVTINGKTKPALRYVADFGYADKSGKIVVEDVKGVLTSVYKIKRHLMKVVHGVDILETK